jgi:tRNA(Ile)-lysidine synthase TilS/MesJ
LCSKLKKAILVKHAKKMKVNKIATGHHIDDAIETLFMNMINEGRISVFSANNYLDRNKIHLIRPFCLIKENHIKKVSKQLKIPTIENSCPNEHDTQRSYMKDFLYTNFYKNPRFKASEHNFQVALLNGNQSNL